MEKSEKLNRNNVREVAAESFSTSTSNNDLERVLVEKDNELELNRENSSFNIAAALNTFSHTPRIDKKENILEYWDKHECRELKDLANIVHAVPSTQVSVERLFSGLKFILNDYRSRLNHDILDDIMIVRTNFN